MIGDVLLAVDQNVTVAIQDADADAERHLVAYVAAMRRGMELRAARDLRLALGASVSEGIPTTHRTMGVVA